jgi:lipoate-protein ligase A
MKLLDLTLESPAENLALDEALLDDAEGAADVVSTEVLRLWEPQHMLVVAGSSSHLSAEINLDACQAREIPVLRRASGGATIVTGPGCLMYAVVLAYRDRSHLRDIGEAHQFVLGTIERTLSRSVPEVRPAGVSDLVIGESQLKFSGNSLRCKRNHFLYHGTILYNFAIDEIAALLKMPSRQPAYRNARGHHDFLTNLPLDRDAARQAMIDAFEASRPCAEWPRALTAKLTADKYSTQEWNRRL